MEGLEIRKVLLERFEGTPKGYLVKQGKRHVTVYLPRSGKGIYWGFWLLFVLAAIRGTDFGWGVAGGVFFGTLLLFLWWWFARFRIVFCEDHLIVRYGVGILSNRKVMPYVGLEFELEESGVSLQHFDDHQGVQLALPGDAWLSNLLESVPRQPTSNASKRK